MAAHEFLEGLFNLFVRCQIKKKNLLTFSFCVDFLAISDPGVNAWKDDNGSENADKCAYRFPQPQVTLSNGARFKLQANWSNLAFRNGTGFNDGYGRLGCILSSK